MNTKKFTLIEMLVVIAIISILASLLMPTLKKSLDLSYQLQCANNLKQIGSAIHVYISDYNFWPWPTRNSNNGKRWFELMAEGRYLGSLTNPPSGLLSLRCKMHAQCTSSPGSNNPINSYVMVGTATTSGTPPVPWTGMYGISSSIDTGLGPNTLANVLSPSRKVGVIERCIKDDYGSGEIRDMRALYNSGASSEYLAPIHINALNAMFIDSHVESMDSSRVDCFGDATASGIGGKIWKDLFAINFK